MVLMQRIMALDKENIIINQNISKIYKFPYQSIQFPLPFKNKQYVRYEHKIKYQSTNQLGRDGHLGWDVRFSHSDPGQQEQLALVTGQWLAKVGSGIQDQGTKSNEKVSVQNSNFHFGPSTLIILLTGLVSLEPPQSKGGDMLTAALLTEFFTASNTFLRKPSLLGNGGVGKPN